MNILAKKNKLLNKFHIFDINFLSCKEVSQISNKVFNIKKIVIYDIDFCVRIQSSTVEVSQNFNSLSYHYIFEMGSATNEPTFFQVLLQTTQKSPLLLDCQQLFLLPLSVLPILHQLDELHSCRRGCSLLLNQQKNLLAFENQVSKLNKFAL